MFKTKFILNKNLLDLFSITLSLCKYCNKTSNKFGHCSGQSQCAIVEMMAATELRILLSGYANPIGSVDLNLHLTFSDGSGATNLNNNKNQTVLQIV
jgi:hypothetical protein